MREIDENFMKAAADVINESGDLFTGTHRTAFMLMVLIYQQAKACPDGMSEGIKMLSEIIDEAQCEVICSMWNEKEKKEKRRAKNKARRIAKKALEKAAMEASKCI